MSGDQMQVGWKCSKKRCLSVVRIFLQLSAQIHYKKKIFGVAYHFFSDGIRRQKKNVQCYSDQLQSLHECAEIYDY